MTIHKAKGLEFDTVIVPGLGRGIRREERPALLWQELGPHGALDLLLTPLNASGAASDPLYELLWRLRARQQLAETDRLLYVAVTRARERLHLFGQTKSGPGPVKGSLLDRLWTVVGAHWPAPTLTTDDAPAAVDPAANWRQPPLRRLPAAWRRPAPPSAMPLPRGASPVARTLVAYDWASAWARQAGSVAHRWLQQIAVDGLAHYPAARLSLLRPTFRQLLLRQGVEESALDKAVGRVETVLRDALADPEGRWVLAEEHTEQLNEYAVTVAEGGRFRQLIIDRAFVAADGVRWIIDYKTSSHEGGERDAFIRSEVDRYAPQLRAYRLAFECLERRPTRTALYFPLLKLLQPVEAD